MRTVPLFASARAVFEARADRRWMPHVWLQNAEEWVFPNSNWRPHRTVELVTARMAAGARGRGYRGSPLPRSAALRSVSVAGCRHGQQDALGCHRTRGRTDHGWCLHASEEQVAKAAKNFDPLKGVGSQVETAA